MIEESVTQQLADKAITSTPPIAASVMTLMGFPLSEWLIVLTLIYTAVQIVIAVYNFKERRDERKRKR